jgi:hypothetical protein
MDAGPNGTELYFWNYHNFVRLSGDNQPQVVLNGAPMPLVLNYLSGRNIINQWK